MCWTFQANLNSYLSALGRDPAGRLHLIIVLLLRLRDESAMEDGGRLKDELVEAEGVLAANNLAKFGEKGRLGRKVKGERKAPALPMMAMLI